MTHTFTRTETNEERFHRKLKEAMEEGAIVAATAGSRANSLAVTKLDEALMWSSRDQQEKERAGAGS